MDVLAAILAWLTQARDDLDLGRQVHVDISGGETVVRVDHRIPAVEGTGEGWRVTTRKQHLPRVHFDLRVRQTINSASLERGRRLYCIDSACDEVLAAMSYHVDARRHFPVMLTAIGLRMDEGARSDLYDRSRGAALLLKQYVHEIARQIGRGGHVDIDADGVDALRDLGGLGFQRAPRVRGMRVSGRHLRQLPLS